MRDTGPGIAPEKLGLMFSPTQIDNRYGASSGTSSASLVRGLIELHGGRLDRKRAR